MHAQQQKTVTCGVADQQHDICDPEDTGTTKSETSELDGAQGCIAAARAAKVSNRCGSKLAMP